MPLPAGSFYFAWVDPGTEFDPEVHNVNDEDVFAFQLGHEEGEFAELEVTITNPKVGLLTPGRKQWVMFSYQGASAVYPLFYGRILGVPTNIFGETVTFTFTARPFDYNEQKAELAEELRVAPFWDPMFVDPDKAEDLDLVLEGRSARWHIDSVTHELTISDVLNGEDGTVNFTEDDYFYDELSMQLNEQPANTCRVKATFPWTVYGRGGLNITGKIKYDYPQFFADGDSGTAYRGIIASYTFSGLKEAWPQPGADLGGGWTVRESWLKDVTYTAVPLMATPAWAIIAGYMNNIFYQTNGIPSGEGGYTPGDELDPDWEMPEAMLGDVRRPIPAGSLYFDTTGQWMQETYNPTNDPGIGALVSTYPWGQFAAGIHAVIGYGVPFMHLNYEATREYSEVVTVTLSTATQPILTDPGEAVVVDLEMNAVPASNYVLQADGTYDVPIGVTGGDQILARTFVDKQRGKDALAHVIAVARANLVIRSRAVTIDFTTTLEKWLETSLRKNASLSCSLLPGGVAVGKFIKRGLSLDGDTGAVNAGLSIGCSIGYGGAYEAEEGDPTYVSSGYVTGYQQYENVVSLLHPELTDLTYTIDPYTVSDDNIDLAHITTDNVMMSVTTFNGPNQQRSALLELYAQRPYEREAIDAVLQEMPTQIRLRMRPLEGGPFETQVNVVCSPLIIPKQIDLESAT